jgi:hypothetical protein
MPASGSGRTGRCRVRGGILLKSRAALEHQSHTRAGGSGQQVVHGQWKKSMARGSGEKERD